MIAKAWQFVASLLWEKDSKVKVLPSSIQPQPPSKQSSSLRSSIFLQAAPHCQVQQPQDVDFRLIHSSEYVSHPSMAHFEEEITEDFEEGIDDIRQLNSQFAAIALAEERLLQADKAVSHLRVGRDIGTKAEKMVVSQESLLHKQYKAEITEHRALKYSRERADYPDISEADYMLLRGIWSDQRRGSAQVCKTGLQSVEKLTYKSMQCVYHGRWLNDEIINIYLELLQKQYTVNSNQRILNSFFATTSLSKQERMIQRVLNKKSINNTHTLIMPINLRNHWYFAQFINGLLIIYDSLQHREDYYLQQQIFKDALKFAEWFFGRPFHLRVCREYPQQNNGFDCGVFMLLGIKDVLMNKQWSFHQIDIRFKRIQIALEVRYSRLFGEEAN